MLVLLLVYLALASSRYECTFDLSQKNSSGQYTFYITYANGSWTANTQSETNKLVIYEADPSTPTPVPPTPSGTEFLLERPKVHSYLEDASARYTNSNTSTSVIFSQYSLL